MSGHLAKESDVRFQPRDVSFCPINASQIFLCLVSASDIAVLAFGSVTAAAAPFTTVKSSFWYAIDFLFIIVEWLVDVNSVCSKQIPNGGTFHQCTYRTRFVGAFSTLLPNHNCNCRPSE